jgi:ketol-acid reductoisomerase
LPTVYHDRDADLGHLEKKVVGVIGYGNQGRAQALNLRDSGVSVIVGNIRDSYRHQAEQDGQIVLDIDRATQRSDIVMILLPDEVQAQVYKETIGPHLRPGMTLSFASGYSIRFAIITPPKDTDVVMLAPRDLGMKVRETYVAGHGVTADIGIHQDFTGAAQSKLLALAKGIGCTRAGALESSFVEETDLDLFSEQALWPAMMDCLYIAYEVLLEKGYSREAIVLELYASMETGDIFREMAAKGIVEELKFHSPTAQYGYLTRLQEGAGKGLREKMRAALETIRDGSFAREWATEAAAGYPNLTRLRQELETHPIAEGDRSIRSLLAQAQGKGN